MKNLLKHLLFLSILSAFVVSCNQDDPEVVPTATPEVFVETSVDGTFTSDDPVSLAPGQEIAFNISGTAEGGFNTLNVDYSVDGGAATELFTTNRSILQLDAGTQVLSPLEVTTSFAADLVGSTIVFTFELVDEESQIGTTTVTAVVTSPEARSYSAVLLAVPTGDLANKNFFSTSTGMVYSHDDVTSTTEAVSPLIDFGYYYGNTDLASIASPVGFETTSAFSAQVANWSTKNATVIKATTMDAAAFNETSSYAAIDAAFDAGTDEQGIITGLSVGDVVAFETVDAVRGLILVTEINGTFNSNDNIKIDVLVQLEAAQ